jgi:hypothetical protein
MGLQNILHFCAFELSLEHKGEMPDPTNLPSQLVSKFLPIPALSFFYSYLSFPFICLFLIPPPPPHTHTHTVHCIAEGISYVDVPVVNMYSEMGKFPKLNVFMNL